jgi:hypothetical protein
MIENLFKKGKEWVSDFKILRLSLPTCKPTNSLPQDHIHPFNKKKETSRPLRVRWCSLAQSWILNTECAESFFSRIFFHALREGGITSQLTPCSRPKKNPSNSSRLKYIKNFFFEKHGRERSR